jgi:hypothetical protein
MTEIRLAGHPGRGVLSVVPFWGFILAVVVVALTAAFILKGQESGFLNAMMADQSERRIELLISASTEDIISEDVPRLESTLEQVILTDPDVHSIRVTDEDGKVLLSQSKSDGPQPEQILPFIEREFPLQRFVLPVLVEGDPYGKMIVEWNPSRTGVQIERHAYFLAGAVAIVGILFGLLGYWFGRSRA